MAREEAARKIAEEKAAAARAAAEMGNREGVAQTPSAASLKTVMVGTQTIRLHYCPAGTFTMGSPSAESGRDTDEAQHSVRFSNGFWIGETEVHQGLWKEVMRSNPSYFKYGDNYPVENISWNDCQEFISKLNLRSEVRRAGLKFSLPTEAQWEYACRAGTTGAYGGAGPLDDKGWYTENSGGRTHPVAGKMANAWGLYDMHGNVCEWCQDWYDSSYYLKSSASGPTGPLSGSSRVLRGGSYSRRAQYCRSASRSRDRPDFRLLGWPAYRGGSRPDDRLRNYGLRVVAVEDVERKEDAKKNLPDDAERTEWEAAGRDEDAHSADARRRKTTRRLSATTR